MLLKKIQLGLLSTAIVSGSLFLSSCSNDDSDTPVSGGTVTQTEKDDVVELASKTDNLSILVDAVKRAGLVAALQGDGPLTVFAPTNDAFKALLDTDENWNSIDDVPVDLLKKVLLFHVVGAKVKSTDLQEGYASTLATGPDMKNLSLRIKTTGEIVFNGKAKPVTVDVDASNGVVHIIDNVMLPADIVDLASSNSNFSSLVAALTDKRHTTNFVEVLKDANAQYTVFAPTNAAFQSLLDSNAAWNTIADIDITVLDAVLKYHVISGANVQSSQLEDNQEVTTLQGQKLTVDLTDGAKLETGSNQSVKISATDVQGTNGVIHVVDAVLLPSLTK